MNRLIWCQMCQHEQEVSKAPVVEIFDICEVCGARILRDPKPKDFLMKRRYKITNLSGRLYIPCGCVEAGKAIKVLNAGCLYSGGVVLGFNSDGDVIYIDNYTQLIAIATPEQIKSVADLACQHEILRQDQAKQ